MWTIAVYMRTHSSSRMAGLRVGGEQSPDAESASLKQVNSCNGSGHDDKIINKAYSVLGIIKKNFIHMDESSFILL